MPRFNSQTLSAANSRAFVRARVPGADREGSADLPLSDSARLFDFGLRLRRATRWAAALVRSRMARDESGEEMSVFKSTAPNQSAGRAVKVIAVKPWVTAAASNRVRDFMLAPTMVETRYSVKKGFTRSAREIEPDLRHAAIPAA